MKLTSSILDHFIQTRLAKFKKYELSESVGMEIFNIVDC